MGLLIIGSGFRGGKFTIDDIRGGEMTEKLKETLLHGPLKRCHKAQKVLVKTKEKKELHIELEADNGDKAQRNL